jgi:hypothetical protein
MHEQKFRFLELQTLITEGVGRLPGWQHRWAWICPLLLLAAVLLGLPFLYASAFTGVEIYDDQGTLMMALHDVVKGYPLYDHGQEGYGPFYYLIIGSLYATGHLPLTHDVVRAVSVMFQMASATSLSILLYRMTGSIGASTITFCTSLLFLAPLSKSAGHPQEICVFLLTIIPQVLFSIERGRVAIPSIIIGFIIAGLALTKINLGAFVGIAVALLAIGFTRRNRLSMAVFVLLIVAAAILPLALMLPLLHLTWVAHYWVFATATIGCSLLVWFRTGYSAVFTPRHWALGVASVVGTAIAIIAICVAQGSSIQAVFNAVTLHNSRFVQNWYLMLFLGPLAAPSAALSIMAAVGYEVLKSRQSTNELALRLVQILKLGIGIAGILVIYRLDKFGFGGTDHFFSIFFPFCWVLLVPTDQDRPAMPIVRGGVGLLSAFMVLYPFPVAGSQVGIAGLLPAAMLPLLLHDAVSGISATAMFGGPGWLPSWARSGAFAAVVIGVFFTLETRRALADYAVGVPLGLPGASLVHVPQETALRYRWAAEQLKGCERFFTFPGQMSFYFWTGKESPTRLNAGDQLALYRDEQQERIIADISGRDMCVLSAPELQQFWDRGQLKSKPPLAAFIEREFTPVATQGSFTLLRRKL